MKGLICVSKRSFVGLSLITIAGIGTTSIFTPFSESKTLQKADVNIKSFQNTDEVVVNSGTSTTKKSPCMGDSGGPAVQNKNGKWYLQAIPKSGYCSLSSDSLLTNVGTYASWIQTTSGIVADSGTALTTTVYPTQIPLAQMCSSRFSSTDCSNLSFMCSWSSSTSKCNPK